MRLRTIQNSKLKIQNSKLKMRLRTIQNSKLKTQNSKLRNAQQFKIQNSKLKIEKVKPVGMDSHTIFC